jgi:hypothetical protein
MDLGKTSKDAHGSLTAFGGALTRSFEDVKGILIGGGIVGAVMKITSEFMAWNQHILEMKVRLGEMATASAGAQQKTLAAATQEGVSVGVEAARIAQTSSDTGASYELAAESRRAVHSVMGGDEGLKKEIQNVIAGALARTGGDADQATASSEMLSRIPGATDSKEAAAAIFSKMEKVMGVTYFASPGEIAQATARGGMGGFLEGANFEKILARMAQARAVTNSQMQSMRLMGQMNVAMKKQSARDAIEAETGRSYLSLSYDERFEAFQSAVAKRQDDPAAMDEFFGEIPNPAERERVREFAVAAVGRQAYKDALKTVAAAPGGKAYLDENSGFIKENVAQTNISEAAKTSRQANLDAYDAAIGRLDETAVSKLSAARATRDERRHVGWWANKFQLESTQIESFALAEQLNRLGITELWAVPGRSGSAERLQAQLDAALYETGISDTRRGNNGVVGSGGKFFSRDGKVKDISGPQRIIRPMGRRFNTENLTEEQGERVWNDKPLSGEMGTVINNIQYGDTYMSSSDRTQLPASAPQIRK